MAPRRTVLLNGPTSGLTSFSLVNRRLAEGLTRAGYDVWTVDAESRGEHGLPDVCLTHCHPYDTRTAPGRVNIFFLQYDYSRFTPADRLLKEDLNARFDLCLVPSRFVHDACRASGVTIPVAVCPLGVDFAEFDPTVAPEPLPTEKRFTFIYVGGATERKGVDAIVDAFRSQFTADDDVALVLKTHGYDHLLPWLDSLLGSSDPSGPEIVHLHGPSESVAGYYTAGGVGVFPFRGEAFALPVLECLASGTPVIVTRGGGPADFCTPENAAFVRATRKTTEGKRHLEPDVAHLARLMRNAYERRDAPRDRARVRETVAGFTWERTAATIVQAIEGCFERKRPVNAASTATVVHAYGETGATSWKKVALHVDAALRSRYDTASLDRKSRIVETCPRLLVGESGFALEHFAAARRADPLARTVLIRGNGPSESVLEITNRERALCGLEPLQHPPVDAWRDRQEVRLADVVVVHSRASARGFVERGRSAETVAVVPLGFTVSRPRPRSPRSSLRFLFIGTDPFRKGIRVLLAAWDALRPRHAELLCLANTEMLESGLLLKYLVRNPSVVVKPLVARRELARIYDEADCQILPSFEDGFAVAVADGMGRGLPAIVSTETGIADLLTDGRDALIVETGSVEALRDAIARVCDDPDASSRLGVEAFETARRRPWSLFEREIGDLAESLDIQPRTVPGAVATGRLRRAASGSERTLGARYVQRPLATARGRPGRYRSRYCPSVFIAARSCFEWDLAAYVADALAAEGVRASVFEYRSYETGEAAGNALVDAVHEARPDVVLGLKLDSIPVDALRRVRELGIPVALWYVDCFTPDVPEWIVPLLTHVDAFFTTAEGMVDAYQALCPAPVHWLYEGVHLPAFPVLESSPRTYRSDVAFLGNVFQPPVPDERLALRRFRLLSKIGERHDLRVWGPQSPDFDRHDGQLPFRTVRWPAYNEECAKVCRAASVVLGINTLDTVRRYFSNRTFLTLASGGFHLTGYVPGLETMFENGRHLVWYRSDEECLDLIEYYLAHPDERARIAEEGRRHVRERYHLGGQVRKLLGFLDDIHGKSRDR